MSLRDGIRTSLIPLSYCTSATDPARQLQLLYVRRTCPQANRGVDSPPANREIYREFCRFGLYSAVFASNLEVNSQGYRPNYLVNRTGDFSHGTGKFLDRTGEPAKA
jgi:hypothetical protein